MNLKIYYGFHTGDYKHTISQKEANLIKRLLGYSINDQVRNDTTFITVGVNELSIKETQRVYKENIAGKVIEKTLFKYELILKINHSKLIGNNGNLIMEYNNANLNKMLTAMKGILSFFLKLNSGNADFSTWSVERIDDAFDIYLDFDPSGYIDLLNQSLYLPTKKHLKYYKESEMYVGSPRASESVYFGNSSYTINVYSKWHEQRKKYSFITSSDPTYNMLRVERQNNQQYIRSFLTNRTVADLFDKNAIGNMRQSLKENIKIFWGTGDYYEYSLIFDCVTSIMNPNDEDYKLLLHDSVIKGGRLITHKNLDDEIYKEFRRFNIAPAYISSFSEKYYSCFSNGVKYSWAPGLYNIIDSEYPDLITRKKYNQFSTPVYEKRNDRYKVHFILHISSDEKGEDFYASGKTYDKCQENMFDKMKNVFGSNISNKENALRILEDICRFMHTVKNPTIKDIIEEFIDNSKGNYLS